MTDLFSADDFGPEDEGDDSPETGSTRRRHTPLAVRMRPRTLDEVVGQKHLLDEGSPMRVLSEGHAAPPAPPR